MNIKISLDQASQDIIARWVDYHHSVSGQRLSVSIKLTTGTILFLVDRYRMAPQLCKASAEGRVIPATEEDMESLYEEFLTRRARLQVWDAAIRQPITPACDVLYG